MTDFQFWLNIYIMACGLVVNIIIVGAVYWWVCDNLYDKVVYTAPQPPKE